MIKLAAFDLDGTLFDSGSGISARNLEALGRIRRQGVQVVIASGRPYQVVRHVLDQLGFAADDAYCVTMNGANVVRCADGQTVSSSFVTGADVKKVAAYALSRGSFVHGFSLRRGLLVSEVNPYSAKEFFGGLVSYSVEDFLKLEDDELFYKILMAAPRSLLERLAPEVPRELTSRFAVIRSLDTLLEFLKSGTGKGPALMSLASWLGIAPSEVIAFGDEQNDIDMVRSAGIGVAMANGSPALKAVADFVTLSNDEDGVAFALDRFVPIL